MTTRTTTAVRYCCGEAGAGQSELKDITGAVRKMNYTLPAKKLSVFSQIAE